MCSPEEIFSGETRLRSDDAYEQQVRETCASARAFLPTHGKVYARLFRRKVCGAVQCKK